MAGRGRCSLSSLSLAPASSEGRVQHGAEAGGIR